MKALIEPCAQAAPAGALSQNQDSDKSPFPGVWKYKQQVTSGLKEMLCVFCVVMGREIQEKHTGN